MSKYTQDFNMTFNSTDERDGEPVIRMSERVVIPLLQDVIQIR